jgi:hypothetical protein
MTNFRMALLHLLRKDEQGADPPYFWTGYGCSLRC